MPIEPNKRDAARRAIDAAFAGLTPPGDARLLHPRCMDDGDIAGFYGSPAADARLLMIFDGRWKYIHAEGFRPMLFDLESDPGELKDLGDDPAFAGECARLYDALFEWARRHHCRITRTPEQVDRMAHAGEPPGILIGFWDEDEIRDAGLKTVYPDIG